ncbi:C-C motif chemokine 18-like [Notolabrus celidotus]|uniref:C-C motif chemokine 18-like n=1 Tax=Notolabrus celidotus TaxID=1203425 RepID=UPI00148F970D|nr:C-C motif chemokine 18-like [Notolabrus celidotus]
MKTLCFTLGLLLLIACNCDAAPQAPQDTKPETCCFKFRVDPIPIKFVLTVTKTYSSCDNEAFIVQTAKRQFCFRQTSKWAQHAYTQKHIIEGSGYLF